MKITKIMMAAAAASVLLLTACKKDDDDDNNNNPPLTNTTQSGISGTINGQQAPSLTSENLDSDENYSADSVYVMFHSYISGFSLDAPSLDVYIGRMRIQEDQIGDAATFYNYFATGAGVFSFGDPESLTSLAHKVRLVYTDANEEEWTTDGLQTGSKFEITQTLQYEPLDENEEWVKYRATVKCNLYNGSQSMPVEFTLIANAVNPELI